MTDSPVASPLLQAIASASMDALAVVDADDRILLFNPAAEAMFRCPAAQAIGSPMRRFIPTPLPANPDDSTRAASPVRVLHGVRADGEAFPIELRIARAEIAGRPCLAAIVRDIAERQPPAFDLRGRTALLDLAHDALFAWRWGGELVVWNRGAERLYGYAKDEAVGRDSRDLLWTRDPEGLDALLARLERAGAWEGELTHARRDGSEVVVESRCLLATDGAERYVLAATRDASVRKRAEVERLASREREAAARAEAATAVASRDRLRETLDDLPSGVVLVVAPDARIEFANAAMTALIFGTSGAQRMVPVYGRELWFLRADGSPLPDDERPGLRALAGERVQNRQLALRREDGSVLPVAVHAAPLREGRGDSRRAIVVVQDVTPLRQAEQLKDDFLALVSHELRTPLTAIRGGARLLRNRPNLDALTRVELLDDVVAESDRLERLLGNLLSLTDISAGRMLAALEPTLLESIVRRTAAEFGARNRTHDFVIDAPPDLPPAEADPDLFDAVLRNLYENAVKYSPRGGAVRTALAVEGECVVVRVADEGVGIAPEHVGAVFERFRRVGEAGAARGMGLGLYLCRELMDAQGGRIDVRSTGLGRGATFTITLPIACGWDEPVGG
ncbi:MAG: PAS domain S-box protein [Thermomicrobiales bacterium]|nr:PAS domain S-box protein [Thermomicrobiales bacterium]